MNLLFLQALESVGAAHRHLEVGELRPCSKEIQQAWEILLELKKSLPPSLDGEVKRSLESVIGYFQTRLMEAKSQHSLRVLQEIESLLTTVHQGWLASEPQQDGVLNSALPTD